MMNRNPGNYDRSRQEPKEFEEIVVQINRVSKKTKGGNKISFSALVVLGDRKNQVGAALGKAPDVSSAIKKAIKKARKELIQVSLNKNTIPHEVRIKKGAAKLILKPAPAGTGIIAGGVVRTVAQAAGIKDLVAKMLGTNNKISNVYATIEALKILKK
jgi:small subunit ribosomal protein S5